MTEQDNLKLEVPDGFEPVEMRSAFLDLVGPVYLKRLGGQRIVVGMRMQPKHMNVQGIAHGGLLVTLADSALGMAIKAVNEPRSLVTVNLGTDFVEAARLGDWVEAHIDLQRVGGRLAFANCYLQVGERRILRASGVFAMSAKG